MCSLVGLKYRSLLKFLHEQQCHKRTQCKKKKMINGFQNKTPIKTYIARSSMPEGSTELILSANCFPA